MKTKIQILLSLFLTFNINLLAQSTVKGIVSDSLSKNGIPYASITFLNYSSDTLVFGTLTNKNGEFTMENIPLGNYFIQISSLGYEKKSINLVVQNKHTDLGVIQLSESSTSLEEVLVNGSTTKIRKEFDKTTYEVDKQKYNETNSVLDILKTLSGISVGIDNTIFYKGGESTLLIDNIPFQFVYPNLELLSADKIQKIELIDASSYSGEIRGGIINIYLKKKGKERVNGLISTNLKTVDFQSIYKSENFINLNYNYKKVNIFSNLILNDENSADTSYQFGEIETRTMSENSNQNKTSIFGLINLGAIYAIDSSSQIVLVLSNNLTNEYSDKIINYEESIFKYTNIKKTEYSDNSAGVLCYFEKKYKKPTQHLTLSLYFSPSNAVYNDNSNFDYGNINTDMIKQDFTIKNTNMNAYFRYNYPFSKSLRLRFIWIPHFWQYNTSTSYTENENNRLNLSLEREREILNNKMYLSIGKSFNKWQLDLSINNKYKHYTTSILSKDYTENYDTTGFFLSFEPTLNISYSSRNNKFSFKYTYENEFPNEGYLLGFVDKTNPYLWRVGNPLIKSIKYHSNYFGYNLAKEKFNFSTDLFFKYANNEIQNIKYYFENGVYIERPENFAEKIEMGINFSYWQKINQKLSINAYLQASYVSLQTKNLVENNNFESVDELLYSYNTNLSLSYDLNKRTSVSTFIKYIGKNIYYYGYSSPYLMSSVKLNKKMMNNRLSLILAIDNFTEGLLDRKEFTNYQLINTEKIIDEMYYKRTYRISLSYNFRKGKKGTEYIR